MLSTLRPNSSHLQQDSMMLKGYRSDTKIEAIANIRFTKHTSFDPKLDTFASRVLVVGIYVLRRRGQEDYYFCFSVGIRLRYVFCRLSSFTGDRTRLCKWAINDILQELLRRGQGTPLAIYVYRDYQLDIVHSDRVDEEISGIEDAITEFYEALNRPFPRTTIVKVIDGVHNWGDFILSGAHGYPPITYYVAYHPETWNLIDVIVFTLGISYGIGYVRLCWKAKYYYYLRLCCLKLSRIIANPILAPAHGLARIYMRMIFIICFIN